MTQPRFDFLEGEHDGFARLADPVRHVRSILFIRGDYWVVRDRLAAGGRHRYVSRFQLAPGLTLRVTDDIPSPPRAAGSPPKPAAAAARVESVAGPVIELFSSGAAGRWAAASGKVSPAYGVAADAPAADLVVEGNGVTEWLTLLVPWGGGAVFTNSTDAGLEVKGPGWTDRLVNGGAEPMPLGLSKGAFEWLWLRQDKEGGITDLVAFGCRSVSLDGSLHPRSRPGDKLAERRRVCAFARAVISSRPDDERAPGFAIADAHRQRDGHAV